MRLGAAKTQLDARRGCSNATLQYGFKSALGLVPGQKLSVVAYDTIITITP